MPFWNREKNWEDAYDEDYIRDRRSSQPRGTGKYWYVPHVLTLAFVGALFVGAIGVISGKTMVEKLLTSLVTPTGFVWLSLILMVYFCLLTRQAWPAIVGVLCWLMLTIGGNEIVSNELIRSLESDYLDMDVFEQEPYQTVVVLGGGTGTNVAGRAYGRFGGDRLILAAELYHGGLVEQFVCTGSQTYRSTELDLHPREEAAEILLRLNVPEHLIMKMRGNNTFEEMQNLKKWLADNEVSGRVGVLTSAWHLPRTLRLAKSNGLELEPIPADFLSEPYSPQPSMIVPSSENLLITSRALKEYLAGLVGR